MSLIDKLFTQKNPEGSASGAKIREIRNLKRISARELGDACSVNEVAIRNYERGIRQVNEKNLKAIAKRLGVNVSALHDRKIHSPVDVMHSLFELSESFEFIPIDIPQEPRYALITRDEVLIRAIESWFAKRREWEQKKISLEELKEWESSFPMQVSEQLCSNAEDAVAEHPRSDYDRIISLRSALESMALTVNNYADQIEGCLNNKDIGMALNNLNILNETIRNQADVSAKKFG